MRRTALLAALAGLGLLVAPAFAHDGNPNFESVITGVEGVEGLKAQILNGDDRLLLIHSGSQDIVVEGYDHDAYLRLRANGIVEVNRRSSATYLNEDRFGQVDVPPTADADADPQWKQVGRNGRYEFHDHRIHWMLKKDPPQVKDRSKRTKIQDWTVPLRAGAARGAIEGSLFWRGDSGGGVSAATVAGGAVLVLASLLFLVIMRRRRERGAEEAPAPASGDREVW